MAESNSGEIYPHSLPQESFASCRAPRPVLWFYGFCAQFVSKRCSLESSFILGQDLEDRERPARLSGPPSPFVCARRGVESDS